MTDTKLVKKIVRYLENKPVTIYRYYSGRFMFGCTCIGFYGELNECEAIAQTIQKKTGRSFRSDNLGFNIIYYFPSITDNRK
jgi:hypothetical protein